jgi:hypothetical protein
MPGLDFDSGIGAHNNKLTPLGFLFRAEAGIQTSLLVDEV